MKNLHEKLGSALQSRYDMIEMLENKYETLKQYNNTHDNNNK